MLRKIVLKTFRSFDDHSGLVEITAFQNKKNAKSTKKHRVAYTALTVLFAGVSKYSPTKPVANGNPIISNNKKPFVRNKLYETLCAILASHGEVSKSKKW
jgi:hypothetical protein